MKRVLGERATSAAVVGIVALLIAGGGYALASGSQTKVDACAKKHNRTLYKAPCKKGEQKLSWVKSGPRGKPGPRGPAGPPGAPGAPGASGFVQIASWAGQIAAIGAGPSSTFVFAGPQATMTTTAGQLVSATGSAALATHSSSSAVRVSICIQPAAGGAITPLGGNPLNYQDVTVVSTRLTYAGSWTGTPGAGTWKIGMCVQNEGKQAIANADWSTGYAFVTNGAGAATVTRQAQQAPYHRS